MRVPITIGLDECGWGAIAGPLTAAACYMPPEAKAWLTELGFTDSKRMSAGLRKDLVHELKAFPDVKWHVHHTTVEEYDLLGPNAAWHKSMRMAVKLLLCKLGFMEQEMDITLIIDGPKAIAGLPKEWEQICIPRADATEIQVSTASVLGKVSRDQLMVEHGLDFPLYGFEQHKGYPTELHLKALWQVGPVLHPLIHRRRLLNCRALQKFALGQRTLPGWYRDALLWLKEH